MAPKKLEDVTIEDLERRLETDGHKPQLARGLVVAAEDVYFQGRATDYQLVEFHGRKLKFLLSFLGRYDESFLAEKIYVKVIEQVLEDSWLFWLSRLVEDRSTPLQQLIDFLGQNPPVGGIKEKVRKFLAEITRMKLYYIFSCADSHPALLDLNLESLTYALLRYQMFDELKGMVRKRIYEAIPALFEAVVEQVGEENAGWVKGLVRWRWDEHSLRRDARYVAKAFLLAGSDTRWLRLLFDLAQAHLNEHKEPYPLAGLQQA